MACQALRVLTPGSMGHTIGAKNALRRMNNRYGTEENI